MAIQDYNPKEIEPKWQKYWLDEGVYKTNSESARKKMFVLDMFPYPSGEGLHVGHVKIYTASDVVARYLRMRGFSVLHPTGWDAFGLPAENSAIKFGLHPADLTKKNIEHFREQMRGLGLLYDWDKEVNTTDPAYYKWTQWIFLQLFKMGLAYEDTIPINWCPKDKTGLANEEVVDGKCERCGTEVVQKPMRQWMLRITKYAEQLLQGLGGLDWPDFIIEQQQNWIGRSEGTKVTFTIDQSSAVAPGMMADKEIAIEVFTTRPDTLFGATYVVIAPEHSLVDVVTTPDQRKIVDEYLEVTRKKTNLERTDLVKEKTGVFTGGYALNPVNGERVPIWIADYVLLSYGTGAIMAVPAHDERDFEFATKYKLPIKRVIEPKDSATSRDLPYIKEGVVVESSNKYDGQTSEEVRRLITIDLQRQGRGKKAISYKLRDWVFSRQRYWGEPIPIIHCEKCGAVPVPESDLPLQLPVMEKYEPTGTGESPLAGMLDWVNVKCPTCSNMGKRETNTMPQWAGSSWYFLRYADAHNEEELASQAMMRRWLPVDIYIGGAEHAVLHLLYARFWTRALHDAGVVDFQEPFQRLRNVGLVMGEDHQKMSKSRGNVINPDDVIKNYGADILRVYEMFMGPFDAQVAWNTKSITGAERFLKRVWLIVLKHAESPESDSYIEQDIQKTIKRVSEGIELFKFNTAIAALMEFLNLLEKQTQVRRDVLDRFVLLISPFAPHVAEELWSKLGHQGSILKAEWPIYDEQVIKQATVIVPVQVAGRVRGTITIAAGSTQKNVEDAARALPNIVKYLDGQAIARVVYVPDRLINFVLTTTR